MASAKITRVLSRLSTDLPWFYDVIQTSPTDPNNERAINLIQNNSTRQIIFGTAEEQIEFSVTDLSIIKTITVPDTSLLEGWSDTDASANWKLEQDAKYAIAQSEMPVFASDFEANRNYHDAFYAQPGYSVTYSQTVTP